MLQQIFIGLFIFCIVGVVFAQCVLFWALLRGEKASVQPFAAGKWIILFFCGAVVCYMIIAASARGGQKTAAESVSAAAESPADESFAAAESPADEALTASDLPA